MTFSGKQAACGIVQAGKELSALKNCTDPTFYGVVVSGNGVNRFCVTLDFVLDVDKRELALFELKGLKKEQKGKRHIWKELPCLDWVPVFLLWNPGDYFTIKILDPEMAGIF